MSEIESTPPLKDIEERGYVTAWEASAFLQEAREKGIEVTELLRGEGFSETLVESVRDIEESEKKLYEDGPQLGEKIMEQEQAYSKFNKANEAFLEYDNMKHPEVGLLADGQELPFTLMMPHTLPEPQIQQPPPHRMRIPKGGEQCYRWLISGGNKDQITSMFRWFLSQPDSPFSFDFSTQDGDSIWVLYLKNGQPGELLTGRIGYIHHKDFPIAQVICYALNPKTANTLFSFAMKVDEEMTQFGFENSLNEKLSVLERGVLEILFELQAERAKITNDKISEELINRKGIYNFNTGEAYTPKAIIDAKKRLKKLGYDKIP